MAGWAKRGFDAADKEGKRQDEAKKRGGIYELFMKDGESHVGRFLNTEPLLYNIHRVKRMKNIGGSRREMTEKVTCSGKGCQYCKDGDRAQYVGAWLFLDYESAVWDKEKKREKKDKNGETMVETKLRLWVRGIKCIRQIKKKASRCDGDLSQYTVEIERTGADTDTTYGYEVLDKEKLTKEDKKYLDEKQIPYTDEDALLDFLEQMVQPRDEDEDEEEEAEKKPKKKSTYRSGEDDDDPETDDDDLPTPKKKVAAKAKPVAKKAPRYEDEDD